MGPRGALDVTLQVCIDKAGFDCGLEHVAQVTLPEIVNPGLHDILVQNEKILSQETSQDVAAIQKAVQEYLNHSPTNADLKKAAEALNAASATEVKQLLESDIIDNVSDDSGENTNLGITLLSVGSALAVGGLYGLYYNTFKNGLLTGIKLPGAKYTSFPISRWGAFEDREWVMLEDPNWNDGKKNLKLRRLKKLPDGTFSYMNEGQEVKLTADAAKKLSYSVQYFSEDGSEADKKTLETNEQKGFPPSSRKAYEVTLNAEGKFVWANDGFIYEEEGKSNNYKDGEVDVGRDVTIKATHHKKDDIVAPGKLHNPEVEAITGKKVVKQKLNIQGYEVTIVADDSGRIFMLPKSKKFTQHSSFLAGKPVAGASMAWLNTDGTFLMVNGTEGNHYMVNGYDQMSGHYRPIHTINWGEGAHGQTRKILEEKMKQAGAKKIGGLDPKEIFEHPNHKNLQEKLYEFWDLTDNGNLRMEEHFRNAYSTSQGKNHQEKFENTEVRPAKFSPEDKIIDPIRSKHFRQMVSGILPIIGATVMVGFGASMLNLAEENTAEAKLLADLDEIIQRVFARKGRLLQKLQ